MFATIVTGQVDLADVFFLVAVILAVIASVVAIARDNVEGALLPAAVAFGFLALLVL
jgi:hypothetical protein